MPRSKTGRSSEGHLDCMRLWYISHEVVFLGECWKQSWCETKLNLLVDMIYPQAGLVLFISEQTAEPTIYLPITAEVWSSILDTQYVISCCTLKSRVAVTHRKKNLLMLFLYSVWCTTCVRPAESCSHSLWSIKRSVLPLQRKHSEIHFIAEPRNSASLIRSDSHVREITKNKVKIMFYLFIFF